MSEAASGLIDAFSLLSPLERHDVLVELARISENDAGDLTDDELALTGEQVFAVYDAEEAERGETSSRWCLAGRYGLRRESATRVGFECANPR